MIGIFSISINCKNTIREKSGKKKHLRNIDTPQRKYVGI